MNYNKPRVDNLILVETGTYDDPVRRSYEASADDMILDQLADATRGGENISPESLGAVAGSVIRPSMDFSFSTIDNGWAEKRFRFLLKIYVGNSGSNGEIYQFISGYTDHMDVSHRHTLDPNMMMYFNDTTTIMTTHELDPHAGRVTRSRVVDSSHILTARSSGSGIYDQDVALRPEDVFSSMQNEYRFGNEVGDVLDARSIIASPMKSRRSNGRQADWLSRTLSAYQNTVNAPDSMSVDYGSTLNSARGLVNEQSMASDGFFYSLMRFSSYQQDMSITYSELAEIFNIDDENAVDIIFQGGVQSQQPAAQRGQYESWTGGDVETMIATILQQSVPGLLMTCMLTGVEFTATNVDVDGRFNVSPYDVIITNQATLMENMDVRNYLKRFIDLMSVEILPGLTNNNMMDIDIYMRCDIFEDLQVSVSVNGGPAIPYSSPTFCDVLTTPIVSATGKESLEHLSADLSTLMAEIGGSKSNSDIILDEPYTIPQSGGVF